MKLDLTHDMYLPDPPQRRKRPTPARDRNLDTFADPNGTREQREAWVRSRQLKKREPLAFDGIDPFLTIGEYAIANMYAQLHRQRARDEAEEVLYQICRKAVEGYKSR